MLVAQGWTVAAVTWPGGLGAFVAGSAADYTGKVVPLGQAIAPGEAELLREITAEPAEEARVKLLAAALERAVDPGQAPPASQVAAVARIAETDRSVRRLADLCQAAGTGQRTLQRMFLRYAGVSPTWVIRRYRLLEAAEAVREGQRVPWAQVAADLGYADQAHLISDFRAAIGQTPVRSGGTVALRCGSEAARHRSSAFGGVDLGEPGRAHAPGRDQGLRPVEVDPRP